MWENKRMLDKPLLVKGDGPFGKLKRWYRRFYAADPEVKVQSRVQSPSGDVPGGAVAPPSVPVSDQF